MYTPRPATTNLHSPTAIGDVAPNTVAATTLAASGASALSGGAVIKGNTSGTTGPALEAGFYSTYAFFQAYDRTLNQYIQMLVDGSDFGINVNSNGTLTLGTGVIRIGGTTASFPGLKRSSTVLQARLADDSAFAPVQGKLTTDTPATTGLTAGVFAATTNSTLVIYDSNGVAYDVAGKPH